MWGESSSEHEILMDGCSFHVRNNLYQFLELASEQYPNEPLWIDAVCINQSHNVEKAVEVRRMGVIYTGAKELLLWLGNGRLLDDTISCLKPYQQSNTSSEVKSQLRNLFDHPYWTRTWITQEVLLSQSVKILCGTHVLEWKTFAPAVAEVLKADDRDADPALQLWDLWTRRQRTLANGQPSAFFTVPTALFPFWGLFDWRSDSQCTDPRDRIYGILALARDYPGFEVSYTESATELFWRAGEHFQAWSMPRCVLKLLSALSLDVTMLAQDAPHTLSLAVSYACSPRSSIIGSLFKSKQGCSNQGCEYAGQIYFKSRKDILLCMKGPETTLSKSSNPAACVHAVVSPLDSPLDDSYEITLFDPGWVPRLLDVAWTSFQVLEKTDGASWQHVRHAWLPKTNLVELINSKHRYYRLQIPSTFVTEHLRSYLSADHPS